MFDPNSSTVNSLKWTITVQDGDNKLTFHSIAELMNFLLFPYMVRAKENFTKHEAHHDIGSAAYTLMRALRAHTNLGLKEVHAFIMGKERLPEPPIG